MGTEEAQDVKAKLLQGTFAVVKAAAEGMVKANAAKMAATTQKAPVLATNENTSPLDVKPIDDKVVVMPDAMPEKSAGGVILPDKSKRQTWSCSTVLAVGPGKLSQDATTGYVAIDNELRRRMQVKPGDRVFHHSAVGIEAEISGMKVRIMEENDLMLILESAPAQPDATKDTE